MKKPKYDTDLIRSLCDGKRSSSEIAAIVGCPAKYVQELMLKENLPRLKQAPPSGERNPAWRGGRVIDRDGYVLVPAPLGHPFSRKRKGRSCGRILEHRLVMEQKLGRYLEKNEVVDHIDGNKLNNAPENLRLFSSNGDHLRETLRGKCPKWTKEGKRNFSQPRKEKGPLKDHERIDTHDDLKKQGEIRRQQILRARELLGKDHPFLLGTEGYLKTKQD